MRIELNRKDIKGSFILLYIFYGKGVKEEKKITFKN